GERVAERDAEPAEHVAENGKFTVAAAANWRGAPCAHVILSRQADPLSRVGRTIFPLVARRCQHRARSRARRPPSLETADQPVSVFPSCPVAVHIACPRLPPSRPHYPWSRQGRPTCARASVPSSPTRGTCSRRSTPTRGTSPISRAASTTSRRGSTHLSR